MKLLRIKLEALIQMPEDTTLISGAAGGTIKTGGKELYPDLGFYSADGLPEKEFWPRHIGSEIVEYEDTSIEIVDENFNPNN